MFIVTFISLFSLISTGVLCAPWFYGCINGPEDWGKSNPACDGVKQSPINIDTSKVVFNSKLLAFDFTGFDGIPKMANWQMHNSGNSLQVDLLGEYLIAEGGLSSQFKALQFHFHWGRFSHRGAEHTINGNVYPCEMHIVLFNTDYGTVREALKHEDGLAVLAFFIQVSSKENPSFRQIIENVEKVRTVGKRLTLRPVSLMSLMANNLNNYYRYMGSLTTPPCSESVIWTIFQDTIHLSAQQLNVLRSLQFTKEQSDKMMVDNYRPAQAINNRTIYSSDPKDSTIFTSPLMSPSNVFAASLIGFVFMMVLRRCSV